MNKFFLLGRCSLWLSCGLAQADPHIQSQSEIDSEMRKTELRSEIIATCLKTNQYLLWSALNGANAGRYYVELGERYFKQSEETAKNYGAVDFAARKEAVDMIAYGNRLIDESTIRYRKIGGKEVDLAAAFKKAKDPCVSP